MDRILVSFGKHRGKPITQLGDAYLHWMQAAADTQWSKLAAKVLEDRKQQREAAAGHYVLDFGEHQGKSLGEVPTRYLCWMVQALKGKEAAKFAQRELVERQGSSEEFETRARVSALLAELKACTKSRNLEKGKIMHQAAVRSGDDSHAHVASTLINMYAKCGSIEEGQIVFESMERPDVVVWNSLLLGYAGNGESQMVLKLFCRMCLEGCEPDARSFVALLKACSDQAVREEGNAKFVKEASVERGGAIQALASRNGYDSDVYVATTLVDMYAKCGTMERARRVFDCMKEPNAVSWTALVSGYAENGQAELALDMFSVLKAAGCSPDARALVAVLKACSAVGALEVGKTIHSEIRNHGLEQDAVLANSLIDLYAKCGSLVEAKQVFDSHRNRTSVTWTALMAGYSCLGDARSVFDLFDRMLDVGLQPDSLTFSCLLSACNHAGLVSNGQKYFEAMSEKHGVKPDVDHYSCMVDMLGRAGRLNDAMVLVKSMPFDARVPTWMAVLGACRKWSNVELGKVAFEALVKLDDRNATAYVMMANLYASRGMWEERAAVQTMRGKLRAVKKQGQSWWTDHLGLVHAFSASAVDHQSFTSRG